MAAVQSPSQSQTPARETPSSIARPRVVTIGDETASVLYLHEVLSELGYLPLEFVPTTPVEAMYDLSPDSPAIGLFRWRYPNVPDSLRQLWNPSTYNVLTKGAVMTFQLEHGLPVDGFAGPAVFRALQLSFELQLHARHPYRYVYVDQSIPQTVHVWQDGRWVFRAICSTGIQAAATHTGTHVIYLRTRSQTMDGISPSGRRYRVDHVPYVSFFYRGEALHGLVRPRYGFPQSVGCVEMSVADAKRLWELTDYGTLVTISAPERTQRP